MKKYSGMFHCSKCNKRQYGKICKGCGANLLEQKLDEDTKKYFDSDEFKASQKSHTEKLSYIE